MSDLKAAAIPLGLAGALIAITASCLFSFIPEKPSLTAPTPQVTVDVFFSPNGGCTTALVKQLDAAKRSIFVQAYSFTSQPIDDALRRAKARGVDVEIVLDRGQRTAMGSKAMEVEEAGIPLWFDAQHAIAHNKLIIIDDSVVIGGSFNYTDSAEKHNAENLTITHSASVASKFKANWELHQKHSEAAQ
jgi:phosphatidylserine/phosphatidylglycerophosphate/cardiolipin synthase-like enzyme